MKCRAALTAVILALLPTCAALAKQGPILTPLNVELLSTCADAAALEGAGTQARYLTMYAVPASKRDQVYAAVSLAMNSFSTSAEIHKPLRVSDTLIRIDLGNYIRTKADFEALSKAWEATASNDPYFHLRTRVVPPGGKKPVEVVTDGGWVDLAAAAKLRTLTGSAGALLRADWWLATVTQPPAYYQFAGIPETRTEYFKSLGIVEATVLDLQAATAANIDRSGISDKPRRIIREAGPLGALYVTIDSATVKAAADPFRNPAFKGLAFDAGEYINGRANGLHGYALYLANGNRADAVDPKIATDFTAHPPGPVIPMLSCVACHHVKNGEDEEAGLRSFRDEQRELLTDPRILTATSKAVAREVRALYSRQESLQRAILRDREDYTEAVLAATGLGPGAAGAAMVDSARGFLQDDVTPSVACRELGIEAGDDPAAAIKATLAAGQDVALVRLGTGRSVQRGQWESAWSEAALLAAIRAARR